NVSAGHVVILIRERPVNQLRAEARDGDGHRAAGAKDARQLSHHRDVVGNVLEYFRTDHPIERSAGEWKMQRVTLHDVGVQGSWRQLAHLDHRGERRGDAFDLVASGVQRHDTRAAPRRLEGVTTEATAEIEHFVAGLETEFVVLSRQHQSKITESGSWRP